LSLQISPETNNRDYSNEKIGTGHVFLRLLQEKKSLAAKILDKRNVCPESSRKKPGPVPQGDAIRKDLSENEARSRKMSSGYKTR
jgi:hypothetical protein